MGEQGNTLVYSAVSFICNAKLKENVCKETSLYSRIMTQYNIAFSE